MATGTHRPGSLQRIGVSCHVDVLEEFAEGAERIESVSIPGFWVKRAWLNPEKPPMVNSCLAEILRARKRR